MSKRIVVVAIDGPAGAGKSTVARSVARRLGYVYVDTGAMYRAVALWALRAGIPPDDAFKLEQLAREARIEFTPGGERVLLNGEDVTAEIRRPEAGEAASKVSAISGVRRAMVDAQRALASQNSVLMEGRDIGTVVFPDADVKIFLDANEQVRAERRVEDLRKRGIKVNAEEVAREIADRDRRDRTRTEAPLIQAPDAIYFDTSGLTIDQVEDEVLKIIRARVSNGKEVKR
jgi:cytidylate kinase